MLSGTLRLSVNVKILLIIKLVVVPEAYNQVLNALHSFAGIGDLRSSLLHKHHIILSFEDESLLEMHGVRSVVSLWRVVFHCFVGVDVGRHADAPTLVPVQNVQMVPRDLHLVLQAGKALGESGRPVSPRN